MPLRLSKEEQQAFLIGNARRLYTPNHDAKTS
jgi:hypothetical protein